MIASNAEYLPLYATPISWATLFLYCPIAYAISFPNVVVKRNLSSPSMSNLFMHPVTSLERRSPPNGMNLTVRNILLFTRCRSEAAIDDDFQPPLGTGVLGRRYDRVQLVLCTSLSPLTRGASRPVEECCDTRSFNLGRRC